MAIIQHYRKKYIEYIREVVGDKDEVLFTTDELLSYVDKWSDRRLTTSTIAGYNNKFYITCCDANYGVRDLTVTASFSDDDTVYVIDEPAALVMFDPDDPENLTDAYADGITIGVSYYCVCTAKLLSDLFMTLSSNHAKLVAAQNIVGVSMDLKMLSDSFYAQSVRWECEVCS